MSNNLFFAIQQFNKCQRQSVEQMLVMLSLMQQQMNTDIDVITSQIEQNLQGYETSLNTIVTDYTDKRKQLLSEALRQLENINSLQSSDLIASNNSNQKEVSK